VPPCIAQYKAFDTGVWANRDMDFIKKVSQRPLSLKEAKAAKDVFLVGSATKVRLVTGNAGMHVLLRCCIFHPVKHTQWSCASDRKHCSRTCGGTGAPSDTRDLHAHHTLVHDGVATQQQYMQLGSS